MFDCEFVFSVRTAMKVSRGCRCEASGQMWSLLHGQCLHVRTESCCSHYWKCCASHKGHAQHCLNSVVGGKVRLKPVRHRGHDGRGGSSERCPCRGDDMISGPAQTEDLLSDWPTGFCYSQDQLRHSSGQEFNSVLNQIRVRKKM